ncbi:hypothetical protein [Emcibacter nanhaiensis]|uniref:Extradiol ring-cleavage dioxygenase LigAB LigA subunit domain-containing protein n=1 Tax=Emcibacter nanhaiensis TaxID=1505037 RepID=A0A501PUH0_9PROT|nr:hypothetical protein [Emcibacter nanhaiensis]TPD62569.1 hypothetical protein FIV46_00360 [Emcibacter nanhaiensis]TPD63808.1 hypothetical protein FIV46_00295 [Emcibacter nanhaiensis]TPD63818.1 hypothetical protein FIV46_00350 [Emcibacter nanhaiensis]
MSVNALEAALWQLYLHPGDADSFRSDAASYAADYRVTDKERELLVSVDVMGLIDHGVNSLLVLMAFQTIYGPERLHDYFDIVNAPAA